MRQLLFCIYLAAFITGSVFALPLPREGEKKSVRHYVKKGSLTPVAPYLTPETAADSIQKAIDVADSGDVVFIMKGGFKNERILLKEGLTLLGESRDSCRIDFDMFISDPYFYGINVEAACTVKNLWIREIGNQPPFNSAIGRNRYYLKSTTGLLIEDIYFIGNNFSNITSGTINRLQANATGDYLFTVGSLNLGDATVEIKNSNIFCGSNVFSLFITVLTSNFTVNFVNCDIKAEGWIEIFRHSESYNFNLNFFNCHFLYGPPGAQGQSVLREIIWPTNFINCSFTGFYKPIFNHYNIPGRHSKIINCNFFGYDKYDTIFANPPVANAELTFKYNLISTTRLHPWMDPTNIFGCDTPYRIPIYGLQPSRSDFDPVDRRLDRFSRAIHNGDPAILNPDGSRSDIGSYGGPYGKSYTYPDLPPTTIEKVYIQKNLSTGIYHVSWPAACEKDIKKYHVYAGPNRMNAPIYATTETNEIQIPVSSYPTSLEVVVMCEDTAGNKSKELVYYPAFFYSVVTAVREEEKGQMVVRSIYPNPANDNIKIEYVLTENSRVNLTLYGPAGEEVKQVLDYEARACGEHIEEVPLGVSSGIYLVRLVIIPETGERIDITRKISVVK